MRVISGTARRINLITPKGMETRPTTDRIKETLFNMLGNLYDVTFLDLFAGSGQIGIEALSRGAEHAWFVDNGKEPIACINSNLTTCKLKDKATVLNNDVIKAIEGLSTDKPIDIIFMDPPYALGIESKILSTLATKSYVDNNTLIIIEADLATDFSFVDDLGFTITKEKLYKTNKHIFMVKK